MSQGYLFLFRSRELVGFSVEFVLSESEVDVAIVEHRPDQFKPLFNGEIPGDISDNNTKIIAFLF